VPRRNALLDHPRRAAIEAAIRADNRTLRDIAGEYGAPYDSLKRYARRLQDDPARIESATGGSLDPVQTFRAAFGLEPTEYQAAYLTDPRQTIFLKARQCGASLAAAALSISTVRAAAGTDVVIVSPSLQQSKEVLKRVRDGLYTLEEPLVQDSTGLIRLKTGSRVISLPGNARAVRGYSPALCIADEASWIADETYTAIRPLLAASGGRLIAQSTPGSKVGWFYELWDSELDGTWLRLAVPATDVPFYAAGFLERERRELPPESYAAEYGLTFGGISVGGTPLFPDIEALFTEVA
jgi:hypothetical protein